MCITCRKYNAKYDRRANFEDFILFDENGHKLCKRCLKYYCIDDFGKDAKCTSCNTCRDKKEKHWNRNDPKTSTHRLVNYYTQVKKTCKCIDCGIDDFRLLEFDHKDPKHKKNCVRRMTTVDAMEEEMKKCEVRCSRCHRIKTYFEKTLLASSSEDSRIKYHQDRRTHSRTLVNNKKLQIGKCEMCGWFDEKHLYAMDFDHLNPEDKKQTIARMVSTGCSETTLMAEIAKCRLLCANCHRLHTLQQCDYLHYSNIDYE
jgi:hypothetical protein